MRKVVCLYGGPGSGKSTMCAGIFHRLKILGFNCEMNREYIKEWIWEKRDVRSGDQSYIFAKQARKERIYIERGMDFIITDSPLILTHFYGMKYDVIEQKYNTSLQMLNNHHGFCKDKSYKVDHFFLKRDFPYQVEGRNENSDTASRYDIEIKEMLNNMGIKFLEVPGTEEGLEIILENLLNGDKSK